jgi:hypothetical protein
MGNLASGESYVDNGVEILGRIYDTGAAQD